MRSVDLALWQRRQNHQGLRGYVLDTKFGPRYDVSQPIVLTRSRQDVSAGTCAEGMISHPRLHTVCSSKLLPPVLPSLACFIVLACLGFWKTRLIRGSGTHRKSRLSQHSLARPGHWEIVASLDLHVEKRTLFSIGNVDSRDLYRIARSCAGTGGRCSVTGQEHVHAKSSASRSEYCSPRDHTRPPCLSFALAEILNMNAHHFQRTHPLHGMGLFIQRVKGYWCGSH